MKIVQITPGAGGMYCGGCLRDASLVKALRAMGHSALLLPLYLPLTLESEDVSENVPIFFGGVSVYLEQKLPWFGRAPRWLHRLLANRFFLKRAAAVAASTRPEDTVDLTLSMLRGEEGYQAAELKELVSWLRERERPDVICLSNTLLSATASSLKRELGVPVISVLQGEDAFVDGLPQPARTEAWRLLQSNCASLDALVAPSRYYAREMQRRLAVPEEKIHVVFNGIDLDGFAPLESLPTPPVLGYFARMCPEKGLDTLIEAYLILRKRTGLQELRLKVGGSLSPADFPFVEKLKRRLRSEGAESQVEFHPNLDRGAKIAFLQSLTVFSVPALYGEAFGLYVLESLACGVPVVQPDHAAFPELIEATGGGLLYPPHDIQRLADGIESLLRNPELAHRLANRGRAAVEAAFSVRQMAEKMLQVFHSVAGVGQAPGRGSALLDPPGLKNVAAYADESVPSGGKVFLKGGQAS